MDRIDRLSLLCYADDVVLLAESEEDLQSMLDVVSHWCKQWRLEVNVSKTKVMVFGARGTQNTKARCCGRELDEVEEYKYLGVWLSKGGLRKARTSWPGKPGEQERWRGV